MYSYLITVCFWQPFVIYPIKAYSKFCSFYRNPRSLKEARIFYNRKNFVHCSHVVNVDTSHDNNDSDTTVMIEIIVTAI